MLDSSLIIIYNFNTKKMAINTKRAFYRKDNIMRKSKAKAIAIAQTEQKSAMFFVTSMLALAFMLIFYIA